MKKLGLVLAGSGGKGSYEIGVWKYLHEIGLDDKFSVISGTSVGDLNAALMATGDYDAAEKIWLNEIESRILDKKSSSRKKFAFCSREGLLEIMDKFVDLDKIRNSKKTIYATCFNNQKSTVEYIKLNSRSDEEIKTYLCATSAIPFVFQKEKINGRKYRDGGFLNGDNVPLKPLLDEKCTHALIVNLSQNHDEDYSGFDIKTIVLHPSERLGEVASGILDFSQEGTRKRIELGYNDCKKYNHLKIKTLIQETEAENEKMTEAEAIAKTDEINRMNNNEILLETLKKISVDSTLVGQISDDANMNWKIGTKGGLVWWDTFKEYNGWKWQQNKVFKQVRLLDTNNNRRVWGNRNKMIRICRNFLAQEVRKELEISQKYEGK